MRRYFESVALLAALAALSVLPAVAAITGAGDVEPANPATWTTSTTAYIGSSANGTLAINAGSTLMSAVGYIGYNSATTGTVTVDGAGSKWTDFGGPDTLNVGNWGNGALEITGGGPDSLYVGDSGHGTLKITNGGTVISNVCVIGSNAGSSGTVTVDGARSTFGTGEINVGDLGTGYLRITNGGTVTSSSGIIGIGGAGSATVDGPGSTWTNSGNLYLGNVPGNVFLVGSLYLVGVPGTVAPGNGTLYITNGGALFRSPATQNSAPIRQLPARSTSVPVVER